MNPGLAGGRVARSEPARKRVPRSGVRCMGDAIIFTERSDGRQDDQPVRFGELLYESERGVRRDDRRVAHI